MSFWSLIGLADKKEILELKSEISSLKSENEKLREHNDNIIKELKDYNKDNFNNIINEITNNQVKNEEYFSNINEKINTLDEYEVKSQETITEVNNNLLNSNKDIEKLNNLINTQMDKCFKLISEGYDGAKEVSKDIQEVVREGYSNMETNLNKVNKDIVSKIDSYSKDSITERKQMLDEIKKYSESVESILEDINKKIEDVSIYTLNNNESISENGTKINNLLSVTKDVSNKTKAIGDIQDKLSSVSESMNYLWTIMKAVWVDSILSDYDKLK